MYKKTCIIDEVNNDWVKNKGALHATQYHPTSVKGKNTARVNCTILEGSAIMSNPEGKVSTTPLKTYKDTCWIHMILHGMWDVLNILDPFDTAKNWYLFHHKAPFTLLTLVPHVEEIHKTGNKHTIDNLEWSGE